MKQAELFVEALKKTLKARGMTYGTLAKKLGVSEATIKRTFSERTFTLDRIEEICGILEVGFLDLAKLMTAESEQQTKLTLEQERALAADVKLFAFFYLLLDRKNPKDIQKEFRFSEHECQRYLLALDKLGLLELRENDKYRMRVTRNVFWSRTGPLVDAYANELRKSILDSAFTGGRERVEIMLEHLSDKSLAVISKKIDRLLGEFIEIADLDRSGQAQMKSNADNKIALLIAYRPWTFSVVTRLRREA